MYGGTKEEMQRLLKDAEAISGIKYDISSYADIIDAICTIQEEMGIAGATADEAKTTISGSLGMMKSAWQNLVMSISTDDLPFEDFVNSFVESVSIVGENLLPRIQVALNGVVKLIDQLAPVIIGKIPELVSTLLPSIIDAGVRMIGAVTDIIPDMVSALVSAIPQFIDGFTQIVNALVQALPTVLEALVSALPTLIPLIVDALVSMTVMLCSMFPQIIQPIIDYLPEIIISIVDALMNNLPILIEGAAALIVGIVSALPEIILSLVDAMPTVLMSIAEGLLDALPILVEGWVQIWETLKEKLSEIVTGIRNRAVEGFNYLKENGSEIFNQFKDKCSEIFNKIKETIMRPINNAKDTVVNTFQTLKSNVESKIDALRTTVTDKFNSIKEKIITPIENAKTKIKGIVDAIKGFFSGMSLSLPHIKLPHFKVTGKLSISPPSVPKLSIDWYKDGGIMTEPTLFDYNPMTGRAKVGGEAGDEAIAPIDLLQGYVANAVASQNNTIVEALEDLFGKLYEILEKYFPDCTKQLVLDTGVLVSELAPSMDMELGRIKVRRERGR